MQAPERTTRQLRMVGWLIMVAVWAMFLAVNWFDWRDGKATRDEVAHDVGRLAFVTLIMVAAQIHRSWQARRPKPPPVYSPTVLG